MLRFVLKGVDIASRIMLIRFSAMNVLIFFVGTQLVSLEGDAETGAVGGGLVEGEVAAEIVEHVAGNAETESAASCGGGQGVVDPIEGFEKFFFEFGVNSRTVVFDVDDGSGFFFVCLYFEAVSGCSVFDGVVDEVDDDLGEYVGIGDDFQVFGNGDEEVQFGLFQWGGKWFGCGADGVGEVEFCRVVGFAFSFDSAEVENIVDESSQALGFGVNDVCPAVFLFGWWFIVSCEQFGVHANACEWCFQLVGNVGDKGGFLSCFQGMAMGGGDEEESTDEDDGEKACGEKQADDPKSGGSFCCLFGQVELQFSAGNVVVNGNLQIRWLVVDVGVSGLVKWPGCFSGHDKGAILFFVWEDGDDQCV